MDWLVYWDIGYCFNTNCCVTDEIASSLPENASAGKEAICRKQLIAANEMFTVYVLVLECLLARHTSPIYLFFTLCLPHSLKQFLRKSNVKCNAKVNIPAQWMIVMLDWAPVSSSCLLLRFVKLVEFLLRGNTIIL